MDYLKNNAHQYISFYHLNMEQKLVPVPKKMIRINNLSPSDYLLMLKMVSVC